MCSSFLTAGQWSARGIVRGEGAVNTTLGSSLLSGTWLSSGMHWAALLRMRDTASAGVSATRNLVAPFAVLLLLLTVLCLPCGRELSAAAWLVSPCRSTSTAVAEMVASVASVDTCEEEVMAVRIGDAVRENCTELGGPVLVFVEVRSRCCRTCRWPLWKARSCVGEGGGGWETESANLG